MKTIYFDLDGTLTDPKVGITRSIQYALEKLGRVAPPQEDLTWCIGPPLRGSLLKLLGDDHLADRPTAVRCDQQASCLRRTHHRSFQFGFVL
jgi:phosphoglycolate phosphatase